MINWKALVAGVMVIIIIGLATQFAFLLTATWLTVLKNKQAIEPQILQILIYTAGFIYAVITLAPGGYIAASISKARVIVHCAIVGTIATTISLATSPGAEHTTIIGLLFVVLGTAIVILGGMLWKWRSEPTAS